MQVATSELNGAGCCGPKHRPGPGFTMDTPHRRGAAAETPFTKMLGHVISNAGLAAIKPEDKSGKVMTRANNLASLTAAMLLQLQPTAREATLEEIAGTSYTRHILDFAKNYPGGLGITDAIRFSLALHFLLGILDAEAKRSTFYSDGYLAFARVFKDAQNRRAGRPVDPPSTNLDGLGLSGLGQVVSTDPSCPRWTPARPCYPHPIMPDVIVDTRQFQADACANDDPFASLQKKQADKLIGITRIFADVFQRPPHGAELMYYGKLRYCADANPRRPHEAMTTTMIRVREAMENGSELTTTPTPREDGPVTPYMMSGRTALTDVGQTIAQAADAAIDFIGKSMKFVTDILCKGFKAILGEPAGGILCDILSFFVNTAAASIAAIIDIVFESLRGTFEFIKLMVAGQLEPAFTALLRSMGNVIFSLSAPVMVPLLMVDKGRQVGTRPNGTPIFEKAEGPSMAEAFRELKVRAARVMDKEPLWPLMMVMAVVGVFSAIGGNVIGAITGVITAVAPMAATFISAPLKLHVVELKDAPLTEIETGITKFIKFILLLFNGVLKLPDIIKKLRGQLDDFMKKGGAAKLTGGGSTVTTEGKPLTGIQRVKYVLDKLSAGIDVVVKAFAKFNIKDMSAAAVPLLTLIPDVLLAILPEDSAAGMTSLTEWRQSVLQSEKDVNKQEQILRDAAKDIIKMIPEAVRPQLLAQQATEGVSPTHAAVTAATIYAAQFKEKSSYPEFARAFRAELLKA